MNHVTTTHSGIGFCGLLTIVLIVLKLLGKITVSWWWVFAPTIVSVGITLILVALLIGAVVFASLRR